MNTEAMLCFLSEDNILNHREHLKTIRLKYSVLEKSFPSISGIQPKEIVNIPLSREDKEQVLLTNIYIKSHETYFSSFSEIAKPSDILRKYYGSEDKFCYELLETCRKSDNTFIYIIKDSRGRPLSVTREECKYPYIRTEPLLALDLYEHAYFSDYGFDKEKYLRSMIAHLNFCRLE